MAPTFPEFRVVRSTSRRSRWQDPWVDTRAAVEAISRLCRSSSYPRYKAQRLPIEARASVIVLAAQLEVLERVIGAVRPRRIRKEG